MAEPVDGQLKKVIGEQRAYTRINKAIDDDEQPVPTRSRRSPRSSPPRSALRVGSRRDDPRVATAAVREASNGEQAAREIGEAAGVEVDVLSDEEEGRLSFIGATKTLGHPVDGTIGVVGARRRLDRGDPRHNWVTVNGTSAAAGTTGQPNSFVTVGANPVGLGVGLYQAVIRVTIEGLAPIDIDVFLRVSAAPQVALNVPVINIAGTAGSQVQVLVPLSSTTTATPYVASLAQYYGASGWLSVSPATGTTGSAGQPAFQATFTANLAAVPAGLHYAVVNFRSMGADIGDVTLPVILTVTQTSTVSANPATLNFAFQASNLAATTNNKIINISASPSANLSYTANVSGDSRITIAKSSAGPGATVQSGLRPRIFM